MDVKQIVLEYLKTNGFDGLWNLDGECGCKVDDLAPCGESCLECQPGYLYPCNCGEHDWHIGTAEARDEAKRGSPDGTA